MDCDLTEEVSLLVDGELAPREAARLRAHVEGCAACRQARESFLLFRQELRSYERAPDPHAQTRALAAILGSRSSEDEGARASTPRSVVGRWWGSLNEAFDVRRLRPAHVATLALLLVAAALGLRWFAGSDNSSRTQPHGASVATNVNSRPVQTAAGMADERKGREDSGTTPDSPTERQARTTSPPRRPNSRGAREHVQARRDGNRTGLQTREELSRDLPRELARVEGPAPPPSSAGSVALYAAGSLRASAADPSPRLGRHAERVERLLRSFRNASLTRDDLTLDVADARRLSKRLLYSNIALRREAASAGDLPVEGLLESVEPILIDISNLPNTPSAAAVGSIKERINRRQLVGALQAEGMLASR